MRQRRLPHLTRERVELEDGDFIDLAWSGPEDGPIILFMHGLEGSLQSHYVGGIMHALVRYGFRVCFMHFRGCSHEPNRLPISYHSGKTDDPQQVLEHIRNRQQEDIYAAIGVSLGGNVLLKWLGEQGVNTPLKKAVAISVPFQLGDAARRLEQGASRFYQRHLISRLQARYKEKFSRITSPLNIDIDSLNTFRLFDDQVTAPLHGFDGVADYYRRSSCRQFIPAIRIPTLILHDRNDPFMFTDSVPCASELPENVCLELAEHGGHVGFISGVIPGVAHYWAEQRIAQWLSADAFG